VERGDDRLDQSSIEMIVAQLHFVLDKIPAAPRVSSMIARQRHLQTHVASRWRANVDR
jgi:hypothetical protein